MSSVFNYEGPVFSSLSRLADLFWLNLLYVLCCIPVITIGAASTALYYVTLKMAKDEEGYITKSFFRSFKENFVQATLIWLLFLLVFFIMVLDFWIAAGGNMADIFNSTVISDVVVIAVGVMAIICAMVLIYVFPILAQFENSVKNTIRNAFLISIRHLPYTFLMLFISAIPVLIVWKFFSAFFLLIFVWFSARAYIDSKFLNKIFALYMPKEETGEGSSDTAEVVDGEG